MQERMSNENPEDLEESEVVGFVNGSSSEDSYHRVVVEEKAKWSPCVWIAAGLEIGHPRWAVLHRGNHSAISLTFSSPQPIQPKNPPGLPQKNYHSARMAWLSQFICPADFLRGVLRGGCIRSASAGTIRKGQAQVPLGTNYCRSPRLRLRATKVSFLAPRRPLNCILCKRP
jgi:hypothetical protein